MIIVAVIGILAAVALPSFLDSVRKGRRAEAVAALTQVQQAQERWRANNGSYADNDKLTVAAAEAAWASSATTSSGYYGVALSDVTASGYTVTATAPERHLAGVRQQMPEAGDAAWRAATSSTARWMPAMPIPRPPADAGCADARPTKPPRPDHHRADGGGRRGRRAGGAGGAIAARFHGPPAGHGDQCRTGDRPAVRALGGRVTQSRRLRHLSHRRPRRSRHR